MVSQSNPSSSRMASPCSLNSGARSGTAGSPSNCTGAAASWNGIAGRRLAVLDVAVGHGLGVGRRLEGVLHDGPLAVEVGQPLAPLVEGGTGEHLVQQLGGLGAVGHQRGVVGEAGIGGQLGPADGLAQRAASTWRPAGR